MKKSRAVELLAQKLEWAEDCAESLAMEDEYDRDLHHEWEEEAEALRMAIRALGGNAVKKSRAIEILTDTIKDYETAVQNEREHPLYGRISSQKYINDLGKGIEALRMAIRALGGTCV